MTAEKRRALTALALYLFTATAMTWPLLARIGDQIPAGVSDLWQNYWNLWWWKTALLEGRSPYTTEMIFFPGPTRLGLHTHSPANMLGTLPINVLFGVPAALNLATFSGFVLAGLGAFLLSREYTRSWMTALPAGLAFAYFPQHVEQALEHLNLASYYGLAFFLWSMVRTIRHGRRWWLATGIFFALNALLAWHNALIAITLGAALAAFESWRSPRSPSALVLDLTRATGVALLLMAPFLVPVVSDSLGKVGTVQKSFVARAIDPLSFVVPHREHPLWGTAVRPAYEKIAHYRTAGGTGYLGWIAILLAFGACFPESRHRPPAWRDVAKLPRGSTLFWLLMLMVFLCLCLGSTLRSDALEGLDGLRMPFYWLRAIPLFGLVRVPNRFLVPAMLALAVLSAVGWDRVSSRMPVRRRAATTAVVLLLMLLDYAWLPFPMQRPQRPEWLEALEPLPHDLAVIDIPSGFRKWAKQDMYLQTLHRRPIATGFVASTPRKAAERMRRYPALRRALFPFASNQLAKDTEPTLAGTLRQLDLGIVVVHLDRTRQRLRTERRRYLEADSARSRPRRPPRPGMGIDEAALARLRDELRDAFGRPVLETESIEIYHVR